MVHKSSQPVKPLNESKSKKCMVRPLRESQIQMNSHSEVVNNF